jgi:hypothetical protein
MKAGLNLWPSGHSSWLQVQRSRVQSRCYQIHWEAVGLRQGPLGLVSTVEELLGRNNSGFSLENRGYGCGDPLLWPHDTLCLQKLALTSPISGGRSIGIVRLRTKATEFSFFIWRLFNWNPLMCLVFWFIFVFVTEYLLSNIRLLWGAVDLDIKLRKTLNEVDYCLGTVETKHKMGRNRNEGTSFGSFAVCALVLTLCCNFIPVKPCCGRISCEQREI